MSMLNFSYTIYALVHGPVHSLESSVPFTQETQMQVGVYSPPLLKFHSKALTYNHQTHHVATVHGQELLI